MTNNCDNLNYVYESKFSELESVKKTDIVNWVLSNKSSFSKFINNIFIKQLEQKKIGELLPQNHQNLVFNYLSDNTPYRGLLLYHGLGSGKSAAGILACLGSINKNYIIITPGSLKPNFEKEIDKWGIVKKFIEDGKNDLLETKHWTFCHSAELLSNSFLEKYGIHHTPAKLGYLLPEELVKNEIDNYQGDSSLEYILKNTIHYTNILEKYRETIRTNYYLVPLSEKIKKNKQEYDPFSELPIEQQQFLLKKEEQGEFNDVKENSWKLFHSIPKEDKKKKFGPYFTQNTRVTYLEDKRKNSNYVLLTQENLDELKLEPRYNFFCKPIKNLPGIWMINDSEGSSNYDDLDKVEKREITKQLNMLYKDKYKFLHYNSGSVTSRNIFNLIPDKLRKRSTHLPDSKKKNINANNTQEVLKEISEGILPNPFDNKVIVIDEVHNLTKSLIKGTSWTKNIFYELLTIAKNTKIICLSGTPLINKGSEIAKTINIIHGVDTLYTCTFSIGSSHENNNNIRQILKKSEYIDYYSEPKVNSQGQLTVNLTWNPDFFENGNEREYKVRNENLLLLVDKPIGEQDNDYILYNYEWAKTINHLDIPVRYRSNYLNEIFSEIDPKMEVIYINTYLFPNNEAEFNKKYIDINTNEITQKQDLNCRLFGKVSFFNETTELTEDGTSVFPSLHKEIIEKIPMSNFQFIEYSKARATERPLESTGKGKGNDSKNSVSYYKVLSINSTLFTFPNQVERIWPRDVREKNANLLEKNLKVDDSKEALTGENIEQKGIDDDDEKEEFNEDEEEKEEFKEDEEKEEDYSSMIEKMLGALKKNSDTWLTFGKGNSIDLSILSPKYVSIFKTIMYSPGLGLIYSQYKSVEGIRIFSMVLDTYGFTAVDDITHISRDTNITEGTMCRLKLDKESFINIRCIYENTGYLYFSSLELIKAMDDINRKNPGYVINLTNIAWETIILEKDESLVSHKMKMIEYIAYLKEDDDGEALVCNLIKIPKKNNILSKAKYLIWDRDKGQPYLDQFNDNENRFGENTSLIFLTSSGAEGISLFNIRQVNIMEPYWNIEKLNQVIGRARRIKSHVELPKNQRNVQVIKYVSVFSKNQENAWSGAESDIGALNLAELKSFSQDNQREDQGLTTDEYLNKVSHDKNMIIEKFLLLLRNISVDCKYNYESNKQTLKSINKPPPKCCTSDKIVSRADDDYILLPPNTGATIMEKKLKTVSYHEPQVITVQDGNYNLALLFPKSQIIESVIYPIYDFYRYFGLDTKQSQGKICVGKINIVTKQTFIIESYFDDSRKEWMSKMDDVRNRLEKNYNFPQILHNKNQCLRWIIHFRRELNKIKEIDTDDEIEIDSKTEDMIKDRFDKLKIEIKDKNKSEKRKELVNFLKELKKEKINTNIIKSIQTLVKDYFEKTQ